MKTIIAAAIVATLTACGGGDAKIDLEQRDQNQRISRENATLNGKAFARNRYPDSVEKVTFDSDSSIKLDCPLGDGWASGSITLSDAEPVAIKCQTTGSGRGDNGCLLQSDFNQKESYFQQDGKCDVEMRDSGATAMLKLGL